MDLNKAIGTMMSFASGSKDFQLLNAVMEIQKELISIQNENRDLRMENHELKNIDITRGHLVKKVNCYYKDDEGPFCTNCFDSEGKLIYLILDPVNGKKAVFGRCPHCKTEKIETNIINQDWEMEKERHYRLLKEFRNSI